MPLSLSSFTNPCRHGVAQTPVSVCSGRRRCAARDEQIPVVFPAFSGELVRHTDKCRVWHCTLAPVDCGNPMGATGAVTTTVCSVPMTASPTRQPSSGVTSPLWFFYFVGHERVSGSHVIY